MQASGEPEYRQLFTDLEKELEKVKEDAAENARMLREEASKAKESASVARAEAARSQADAMFEKQRTDRQAEHLEEQRLQMQQVSEHNSKYQVNQYCDMGLYPLWLQVSGAFSLVTKVLARIYTDCCWQDYC